MSTEPARNSYKILLVAGLRFPIAEPFVGGLEAHTAALARGLRARGHSVVVAGAVGSDPDIIDHFFGSLPAPTNGERADTSEGPDLRVAEYRGFANLADDLRSGLLGQFDVIHNNSLYPLLIEQGPSLPAPLITTLHTPPLPWAARVLPAGAAEHNHFVAVSRATATSWAAFLHPAVVGNGIDTDTWALGPGGSDAVWSGRLVAEKAPHLAIDIARAAGLGLTLAGPVVDDRYFRTCIEPRLDARVRWAGHLSSRDLAALVGRSAVALVTPAWDEPFGLVAAEAMACGTPVVAFARGGLPEVVTPNSGRLLPPPGPSLDGAGLLAARRAIDEVRRLSRPAVRREALDRCSVGTMASGYEEVYRRAVAQWQSR